MDFFLILFDLFISTLYRHVRTLWFFKATFYFMPIKRLKQPCCQSSGVNAQYYHSFTMKLHHLKQENKSILDFQEIKFLNLWSQNCAHTHPQVTLISICNVNIVKNISRQAHKIHIQSTYSLPFLINFHPITVHQ